MSMINAFYGDYGMSEATARRRRSQESIANRQAAMLGQKRGQRSITDLTRRLTEGFRPKMSEYGQRGLAGPQIQSGIQRRGLERYASDMQSQLGEATEALQDEQNAYVLREAQSQADLDDYIQQLAFQKQQNIINAATALKQYAAY